MSGRHSISNLHSITIDNNSNNVASDNDGSPLCAHHRTTINSTKQIQTVVFSSNPMLARKPKQEQMVSYENMHDLSYKLHELMRTNATIQAQRRNHSGRPARRKSRTSLVSTYKTMDTTTKRVVKHCIIDLDEAFDQWPPRSDGEDDWWSSCCSSMRTSSSSMWSSAGEEEDYSPLGDFNGHNNNNDDSSYYIPEVASVFSTGPELYVDDDDSSFSEEEDSEPQQGLDVSGADIKEWRRRLIYL